MDALKNLVAKKAANISDKTVANDSLAAKAAASNAYLNAALEASTPELKQLFSTNLTQMMGEHAALSQLALNKGWMNPYDEPDKQLLQTFNHSKDVLENNLNG